MQDCTTAYYCSNSCQMAHVQHAQDCIQMIKCRKYIHVHRNNHPVYKKNKDISNIPDKEVFHVFVMKEGSPVTQEFSIERKKMIKDSFVFRVHVEEFSTQIKQALHDKSKCRNCILCNISKNNCLDCKLGMKMEKNTALIVD